MAESRETHSCITTVSRKKKRRFIVVGDSFLKGREGLIRWAGPPQRKDCCFPGAQVQPLDYYLLLLSHVGGDKVAVCSPRVIKRDFRALGRLVREPREQVIFPSLLPVAGGDIARNRRTESINTRLRDWCHRHYFGFFDNRMAYTTPGLLASDRIYLSQRGKGLCSGACRVLN